MTRALLLLTLVGSCLGSPSLALADAALPGVFGDGMVLQRDLLVPVWGRAAPSEAVVVSFAGQRHETRADLQGRWGIRLDPLTAGGPHELVVEAKNRLVFKDVLVGEVWLCSGQSNMAWPVSRSRDGTQEVAQATFPKIRLLTVPARASDRLRATFQADWRPCSPQSIPGFSAVAFYFGRELRRELDVPIGLIQSAVGGTPAEAWTSRRALEAEPTLAPLLRGWGELLADPPPSPKGKPPRNWALHPHRPANLYNGMIRPLIPYAIRGVIWYQGESNAARAHQYRTLFPTLIRNWRGDWNQGAFPFLYVQLANFLAPPEDPGESKWAELREAQSLAQKLPNTGQAVAIDLGEARDIHPKNKQEVGRRLSLLALNRFYGKARPDSGPVFDSLKRGEGELIVTFRNADGGLKTRDGGPVRGFAIASDDTDFHWARARIEGETLRLTSPAVKKPYAVRYGWANNPRCNLINAAGLPLAPFRSDDWPGLTEGEHLPGLLSKKKKRRRR